LFLKFVKELPHNNIFQLIINYLTSDKKQVEKDGIMLKTKVLISNHIIQRPKATNEIIDIKLTDILKIDENEIIEIKKI